MISGAIATEVTENRKTGPMSTTMVSQGSCPPSCSFYNNGCYAESGPSGIHTNRVNKSGEGMSPLALAQAEAEAIRTRLSGRMDLRLHVVGDCRTSESASIVAREALHKTKRGRTVFTYTHAFREVERRAWEDVSVLASCETPALVMEAQDRGWATAVVVPKFKSERLYVEAGIKVLPCPYMTRGVSCVDCRLCMKSTYLKEKGISIGFEPHGARRKVVERQLVKMGSL